MNVEMWEKAVAFHGHECAGLAIGVRAVESLMEHIPTDASKDEEIVCITENDTCAVDAVQSLLSCTAGKGNLIFRLTGKMAFNFYFRGSGKALRVYFKGDFTDIPKDLWMNYILDEQLDKLFSYSEPVFTLPEPASIFRNEVCESCGERVREDMIKIRSGKKLCIACFENYVPSWRDFIEK